MARSKSTITPPAPEPVEAAPAEQQAQPVTLTGRLCADPVLRHTKSGKAVTTIRIVVNTPGAQTSFHSVVVWNRNAKVVWEYLRKGPVGRGLRSPAGALVRGRRRHAASSHRDPRVARPVPRPPARPLGPVDCACLSSVGDATAQHPRFPGDRPTGVLDRLLGSRH